MRFLLIIKHFCNSSKTNIIKIIFLTFIILISHKSYAIEATLGLKGGFYYATLSIQKWEKTLNDLNAEKDRNTGFLIGLYSEVDYFKKNNFGSATQMEFLFSLSYIRLNHGNFQVGAETFSGYYASLAFLNLEIPISQVVKYYLKKGNLFFSLGPNFIFMVKTPSEANGSYSGVTPPGDYVFNDNHSLDTFNFGLKMAFGYELKFDVVALRFEFMYSVYLLPVDYKFYNGNLNSVGVNVGVAYRFQDIEKKEEKSKKLKVKFNVEYE